LDLELCDEKGRVVDVYAHNAGFVVGGCEGLDANVSAMILRQSTK
jgi:hypothetical protein